LRDALLKTVVDAGVLALVFFAVVVVGMDLPPEDFRRVARQPRIVVAATAGQFLMLLVIGVANLNLVPTSAQVRTVVPPETWQASWLTAVKGCGGKRPPASRA
jgi:predicted Na+-dependent transporter